MAAGVWQSKVAAVRSEIAEDNLVWGRTVWENGARRPGHVPARIVAVVLTFQSGRQHHKIGPPETPLGVLAVVPLFCAEVVLTMCCTW